MIRCAAACGCFLASILFGDAVVLEQNIQALDWVAGGLALWVSTAIK